MAIIGIALLSACADRHCTDIRVCWANRSDIIAAAARCGVPNFDPPALKSCKLDVSLLKNGDVETKGICPDSGWTFHTINQVTPTKIFTDVWFTGNGTKTHKISHAVRIGDCPDKDLNADSATQTPPKLEPKL